MLAIKTTELVKRYKNITAVDRLNLEIHQGELFSLLGVNGAGKTTTIKMLSCLTKPTDGDAIVGGYSVTNDAEKVKRLIGVSPQETAVALNLSVKENLVGQHPNPFNNFREIGYAPLVLITETFQFFVSGFSFTFDFSQVPSSAILRR